MSTFLQLIIANNWFLIFKTQLNSNYFTIIKAVVAQRQENWKISNMN